MEKITLNIIIKIGALVALLAIAFSIAYYFVYFLPHKEKVKSEQQEEQYRACLQKCDVKYPTKLKMPFDGPDYHTLYETCNFECREKYAEPESLFGFPELPSIELPSE